MTAREKKTFFITKIRECTTGYSKENYSKMQWKVGNLSVNNQIHLVCKKRFLTCYGVGHTYIDGIIKLVKGGTQSCNNTLNDSTAIISREFENEIISIADSFGQSLTYEQVAAMKLPNTEKSLLCYGWLHRFFSEVADETPNKKGEVHIECSDKKQIWKEFVDTMQTFSSPFLNYPNFCQLWSNCFQHVKLRKFKAVSGKCAICAKLSELRDRHKDVTSKRQITALHALHRSTYMGERAGK